MFRYQLVLFLTILQWGCSQPNGPEPVDESVQPQVVDMEPVKSHGLKKLSAEHLPNPVQLHPQVISGGLPAGDEAFAELAALGVKTIISVDGATPDVETARRHGLTYVHLPHGYDGIPDQRAKELAKAVRELEGPVYIHCHHGKHRSPAAASVACVTAGLIEPTQALGVLELAGTSLNYRGLFRSAEKARPLDAAILDELQVEFHERVAVPPMAEAMVGLEHTHDHLKEIAAAGWKSPPEHPDLEPAHEALLLREHFTELLRTEQSQQQPDEFQQFLRDSEQAAQELEAVLRDWTAISDSSAPPETLGKLADRITANCKACHQSYRDVPLDEKPSQE